MTTSREKRNPYQNRVELLQGTLDMLILQTLQWGPQHGYGISQAIRLRSGEVLQVERTKYYRITATGKRQLASDHGRWQQMVEAIGAILSGGLESGEP